jgi:nucleotide-binding universal stress UspA family protein
MADTRKILLAVDLSAVAPAAPQWTKALEWAVALAVGRGAALVIAAVEPGQPTSEFGSVYAGLADPGIGELAQKLARLVPSDPNVSFEHRVLRGEPVAEIVRLATTEAIDAVVLGVPPASGLKKALFGGTVEGVLKGLHCPVLVLK